MEKEGLIRGINYFEQNGVPIGQIVTDRHLQVAKWLRENLPETTHNIDVWHVAKGNQKNKNTILPKINFLHLLIEEYYSSIDCHRKYTGFIIFSMNICQV